MHRKRALFLTCMFVGMLGGASAAGLAFVERSRLVFLEVLAIESFWGCLLGWTTWLVLDHQEARRGWTLHPVTGALWTLAILAPLAWLPALWFAAMSSWE